MEELIKRLNAVLIELQDAAGKVESEVDSFDPPEGDEESTSPWEDCKSYLDEAIEAVENAVNSAPSE